MADITLWVYISFQLLLYENKIFVSKALKFEIIL